MNLELAQAQSFPRVVEIVNNAYRGLTMTPGWTNETDLLSGQRIDLSTLVDLAGVDGSVLLILRERDRIVGNVALQKLDRGTWYLSMLAVDPLNQQSGLGKEIMKGAEAFALERGAEAIRLSVIAQRTALIEWYERRGYVRTGQMGPFPYDDPSVGTPLRDDLALVSLKKVWTNPIGN